MRPFGTSSRSIRPDHPFSKRFSRQSKVSVMRGHRARVPGPSGSPIPIRDIKNKRAPVCHFFVPAGRAEMAPWHTMQRSGSPIFRPRWRLKINVRGAATFRAMALTSNGTISHYLRDTINLDQNITSSQHVQLTKIYSSSKLTFFF
jgi:hypothetical protein